jgi:processive 1,2-diacylglycerol beta-glucosyltransferase
MHMAQASESPARAKVVIASATVGAGHNSVARALEAGLVAAAAPIETEVVDVLTFTPRLFRAYYAGGFALAMSRFPREYGIGFRLTNRPQGPRRGLMELRRLFAERAALRAFGSFLRARRPDLVINTHFLAAPYVAHLARRGVLRAAQAVTVTDIEVHRFWYSEGVDHWFVPCEYSARPFLRWGVHPDRITVSGIAIHPKWDLPLDRREVLARWSLPADRPIVALTGGTEFTCGPVARIARGIVTACGDVHLVGLAGRNRTLLARLSALARAGRSVTPVGFTDRLHELIEVCSLVVTKAGGITTAECLAKGKPMVLTTPVPGQEGGNARYLASEGAAVVRCGVESIVRSVRELLGDCRALAAMSDSARRIHRPARQTIVQSICRMLFPSSAGRAASPQRASLP